MFGILQALAAYRKRQNFDPQTWITNKCTLFNDYMRRSGLTAAVVSVSGGVDSAVTLGVMKKASEMKDSPIKVVRGISQPIHSSAWAYNRAKELCDKMGVVMFTVDQTGIYDSLKQVVDKAVLGDNKDEKSRIGGTFAGGQLRSYMRTPVGYYVAQLMSQNGTPCVVMGTGNKDEDGYLAYFCKAGDGVVDIQLISDLHKSQVFAVGRELGVPHSTLSAAPSADLWDGQTDEDELGFSYDFVELFTGHYLKLDEAGQKSFVAGLSPAAAEQFTTNARNAEAVHKRNKHKLGGPVNL